MARSTRSKADAVATPSIGSFTRVTKAHAAHDTPSKKAVVSETPSLRKRKAVSLDEAEGHTSLKRRNLSFPPSSDDESATAASSPSKRSCRRQEAATPTFDVKAVKATIKGKRVAKATPSITETAHRPSEITLVSRSKRQGKATQTKLELNRKTNKNTSYKDAASASSSSSFPPHLADLIGLHKAFLSTVTLQFVHHGDSVPLDISTVAPHISRAWGKREVTTDDIRRCIAIQSSTISDAVSPSSLCRNSHE
jgi:hypothetical protein